jgi:KaiC/GvpD/RAD55 family RecA-like ATPase
LVEFDPDSLWYETSLTISAQALKAGVQTQYHTFMHIPAEIRQALQKLVGNLKELESEDRFRLIDSYTSLTGLPIQPEPVRSFSASTRAAINDPTWLKKYTEAIVGLLKDGANKRDKGWLHIDDNTSIYNRYFKEEDVLSIFQTRVFQLTRILDLSVFHSVVAGVWSESFYKQFEAQCDGVIDFKTEEDRGRLENFVRIRSIRGRSCDSRWRRLQVTGTGEVVVENVVPAIEPQPYKEFEFETEKSSKLFVSLADAFIEDYMVRGLFSEKSGWRTLGELGKKTGISRRYLYAPRGGTGVAFSELVKRGLVEVRYSEGERGRGGRVIRVRIAFDKEPVKSYLHERVKKGPGKKTV